MNKVIKTAAAAVATLAVAASTSAAPFSASAYWRSTGDRSTLKLVDCDKDGDNCQMKKCDENGNNCSANYFDTKDTPIFNSIINNPNYGDERNFVSATTPDNIHGKWAPNEIVAQDGQTYVVRIYMHNNNQYGEKSNETKGTALDTRAAFSIPDVEGTAIEVGGWINSSNASDKQIYDHITFKSADGRKFHLEYVKDSAVLQNQGFAGLSGTKITDPAIVTSQVKNVKTGALIGYHGFDGKVPGCFKYDQIIAINVKAVYDDFTVDKKVRLAGTHDEFTESVNAKVGDKVEYQIEFHNNTANDVQENVIIRDVLPNNMVYVGNTTYLYNSNHKDGMQITPDGDLFTTGINIGAYKANASGWVRFTAEVVDKDLACGDNVLVNWAQGKVADTIHQDHSKVKLAKVCENTKLPEAGPTVTIGGAVAAGTIVTAAGYFIMSRRAMR